MPARLLLATAIVTATLISVIVSQPNNSLTVNTASEISQNPLMESIKNHVIRFGYLSEEKLALLSEKEMLSGFQFLNGLEETGVPDNSTMELMRMPRCGVREIFYTMTINMLRKKRSPSNEMTHVSPRRTKRYKWNKKYITYRISEYSKQAISEKKIDDDIAAAFKLWEQHANLKFVRSSRKGSEVDIEIKFVMGDHGDHRPFINEMAETLGHAYPPSEGIGGDIHFNDNYTWSEGTLLLHTATHEIGHALGLHHVMIRTAIMSPYQGDSACPVVLDSDDIRQIQALYGPKELVIPWTHKTNEPETPANSETNNAYSTTLQMRTTKAPITGPIPTQNFWKEYSTKAAISSSSKNEISIPFTTIPHTTTTLLTETTKLPATIPVSTTSEISVTEKTTLHLPIKDSMTSTMSVDSQTSIITTFASTTSGYPDIMVEGKSIESTTTSAVWEKFVTMVQKPTVVRIPTSQTNYESTATVSDLDNEITPPGSTTENMLKVLTKDLKTTPLVHSVTPKYVEVKLKTAMPSSTRTSKVNEIDNNERIYLCDSNKSELCSKKDLEENLTEDILALGSGNGNEDDSDDDVDYTTISRAIGRLPIVESPSSETSVNRKTDKTTEIHSSTTISDLFLIEESETPRISAENLTLNPNQNKYNSRNIFTIKGNSVNASAKLWLSIADICLRSFWILLILLLTPIEYLSFITLDHTG